VTTNFRFVLSLFCLADRLWAISTPSSVCSKCLYASPTSPFSTNVSDCNTLAVTNGFPCYATATR
jgi:hypothetical protein